MCTQRLPGVINIAICLAGLLAPAQSQQLSKQAKIDRLLELMNSQASMTQMLDQMTAMTNAQMKSQMPNATPEQVARAQQVQTRIFNLMKSRMSWERIRPEMSKIYAEVYSDGEINGLLSFFESPAGASYLEKSPIVTEKIMKMVQAQMGDLQPEIQRIIKESAQTQ